MSETGLRKWIIAATVILVSIIELIDTSIVNVALPQRMGNLGATLDEITWVITAYVVANVIVIPMTGWLSQLLGRRNYLTGSVIVFTIASFLCGNSTGIWELVAFRFIQGAAGAALLSTSQAVLYETFPVEQRGIATAMFGMGVIIGPTIGPTLGGWITDNYNWPWIFYVNLPIGVLATFLIASYVRGNERRKDLGRVDYPGIALLVLGVGSLQIMLELGERKGWWESSQIVTLAIVAALGIATFIWRELTTDHPVVNLRLLGRRSLGMGTFFTFVMGFGLYGSVFIFPVFAQSMLGMTAMQTGLILMPGALTTALCMPAVGKLLQRGFPAQVLNAAGFFLFFCFTWTMAHSTLASGTGDFLVPLILRGLGMGFLFVPLTAMALSSLRGTEIAQGTGLTNMMRQLGGAFGVAVIANLISRRAALHRSNLLSHLSIYDPAVRERLVALGHMGPGVAGNAPAYVPTTSPAYAALEGALQRQSYLLSYMDAFLVCGIFFLACIPLLLLFKRGKTQVVDIATH
jgi:DHA2 family multidrug resistance protein